MEFKRGEFGQSIWPKPDLEKDGQIVFWNRQASLYETADMTTDNCGEMVEVIERFRDNSQIGREIIVLGGAVGCRDPKMILREAICQNYGDCLPPVEKVQILFSDLSSDQVDKARTDILAKCKICPNIEIDFLSGPIHEICQKVQPAPRSLMLGVYSIHGFFHADPSRSYPMAGFEEYLKNSAILGDHFWFDWLFYKDGKLLTKSSGLELSVSDSDEVKQVVRKQLLENYGTLSSGTRDYIEVTGDLIAIQVVGVRENHAGFFISHWFSIDNLNELIDSIFPWPLYLINFTKFPKGALFEIRPADQLSVGAVTVLNNVIGNILPDEQLSSLRAIQAVIG